MNKKALIVVVVLVALFASFTSSFAVTGITCPKCDNGTIIIEKGTYVDSEWNNGPHGSCTKNYGHSYHWNVDYTHYECDSCSYSTTRTRDYGWSCD